MAEPWGVEARRRVPATEAAAFGAQVPGFGSAGACSHPDPAAALEGGSLAAQISTARHCVITVVFLALCAVCGVAVVLADISLGFTVSVIGATVVVAVEFFIPAAMCRSMGRTFSALVFGLVGLVVLTLGLFVTVADEACGDAETAFCKAVGA